MARFARGYPPTTLAAEDQALSEKISMLRQNLGKFPGNLKRFGL